MEMNHICIKKKTADRRRLTADRKKQKDDRRPPTADRCKRSNKIMPVFRHLPSHPSLKRRGNFLWDDQCLQPIDRLFIKHKCPDLSPLPRGTAGPSFRDGRGCILMILVIPALLPFIHAPYCLICSFTPLTNSRLSFGKKVAQRSPFAGSGNHLKYASPSLKARNSSPPAPQTTAPSGRSGNTYFLTAISERQKEATFNIIFNSRSFRSIVLSFFRSIFSTQHLVRKILFIFLIIPIPYAKRI
jgi:hypothetical protein